MGELGTNEVVEPRTNAAAIAAGFRLARYLCERRLQANLSLEQVHRHTKVPLRSLMLLEAGRLEELPADVFVRGFLKSYSECVGASMETVFAMYEECFVEEEEEFECSENEEGAPREFSFAMIRSMWRGESRSRSQVTVAAVLLAIVATLTMSYLLRRPSDRGDGVTIQWPSQHTSASQETLAA